MTKRISQADAADLKGVTRQNIGKLSRNKWGFFVDNEIDIEHPDWQMYLAGGKPPKKEKPKSEKKAPAKKSTPAKSKKGSRQHVGGKSKPSGEKTPLQTGTEFDPKEINNFPPTTIRELKTQTEVHKLNIEILARYKELLQRELFEAVIQEISNLVQSNFVDLGRRVSAQICQRLERPGLEKEVEKIINPDVQRGIQGIKECCAKNMGSSE